MTPALPGPLAALAPLLRHYGYGAVVGMVFLDNVLVPAPGQTILIAAAVFAGAGHLNIVVLGLVAFLASVAGGATGYLVGRTGGRAFIHRFGRYLLLPAERFAKAEAFFTRNGAKVVVLSRFIDGLRQTGSVLAGTTDMPWRRFALHNTIGSALWVGAWSALGYAAGTHIGPLYTQAIHYQLYLLLALAALAVGLGGRHLAHRRRRADPAPGTGRHRRDPGLPSCPSLPPRAE